MIYRRLSSLSTSSRRRVHSRISAKIWASSPTLAQKTTCTPFRPMVAKTTTTAPFSSIVCSSRLKKWLGVSWLELILEQPKRALFEGRKRFWRRLCRLVLVSDRGRKRSRGYSKKLKTHLVWSRFHCQSTDLCQLVPISLRTTLAGHEVKHPLWPSPKSMWAPSTRRGLTWSGLRVSSMTLLMM